MRQKVRKALANIAQECYNVHCGSQQRSGCAGSIAIGWLNGAGRVAESRSLHSERGETAMKEKIHPKYGECVVRCVCGETFVTGSTKKELKVDICSKCHPFYTGKQKLVDTGGRVDRFKKRFGM